MNSLVFSLFLLLGAAAFAQAQLAPPDAVTDSTGDMPTHDAQIMLVAKMTREGAVLRWAPDKPGAFHILNTYGYTIERIRVGVDGDIDPASATLLTPEPLRPWTMEQWTRAIMQDTSQIELAIAAQLMHGQFVTPPKNPNDDLEILRNGVRDAENRFGFALMLADTDPRIAEGMALRYVDRDVRPGERVIYRVTPAGQAKDYSIDTSVIVLDAEIVDGNPAPENIRFTSGDRSITLHWDQHPFGPYSAWLVDRSADGGRSWITLTRRPHVIIAPPGEERAIEPVYEDKAGIENYTRYTYRVRGINAFGEHSEPAEITAWAMDQSGPDAPKLTRAEQYARNGVVLQWEQAGDTGDLQGFIVSRAANPKSSTTFTALHEDLLPPSTRMFMDSDASDRAAWYVVTAVDTAGNRSESVRTFVQVIDSLPPASPRGVTASVDSTGLVTIRWSPNTEEDIDGYRVLWANSLDHEFSQLTPDVHRDTAITQLVTLQTSTPHVYYKVVAVDKRFMHSAPSDIVEIKRPDILPPDAPVFTDLQVSDTVVVLGWAHSGSDDVLEQRLERRSAGGAWQVIARLDTSAGFYADGDVEARREYEYRITAVDDDGLLAHCPRTLKARPYASGRRDEIQALEARYDGERSTVTLTWDYPASAEGDHWFVIYRSVGDGKPSQYATSAADARTYTDPVKSGETYHYAVRVKSGSGDSPISAVATVTVQ